MDSGSGVLGGQFGGNRQYMGQQFLPPVVLRPEKDADFLASMGRSAAARPVIAHVGISGSSGGSSSLSELEEECIRTYNASVGAADPNPSVGSGWERDVGGASAVEPTDASSNEGASGPVSVVSSLFSAPKPGLKAPKRPPARGKGVMGAVLSSD